MTTYGVVTICLNSSATIRRAIESVLSQSVLPKEYIFVDGGSTDGTVDIIEETIRDHRQGIGFELLHQQPLTGIAAAWNIGLNRMNTDIVFILNSDDWYERETAVKVISCFDNLQDVGIILGSARCFSKADLKPIGIRRPKSFSLLPFLMTAVHPACFVRRAVYQRVGMFNERYKVAADYDFIYRCRRSSILFKKINDVVTNIESGGFASNNKEISRKELLEIGVKYGTSGILPRVAYLMRLFLDR